MDRQQIGPGLESWRAGHSAGSVPWAVRLFLRPVETMFEGDAMREVDNAATEPVGGGQREGAVSTLLAPFTATVPSRLPYPVGIARCTDVTGSGTSLTGSAVLAGSRLIGESFRQIRTTTVQMNGIWRCAVRET